MTTNETNNQGVDFTVEQVYNILYGDSFHELYLFLQIIPQFISELPCFLLQDHQFLKTYAPI